MDTTNRKSRILLGADPELFCMVDSKFISAHDYLPGTKYEPFLVDRGAVQVDGVAAEFNIFPAETEDEFLENLRLVQNQMQEIITDISGLDISLVASPTAFFDKEYFDSLPEEVKLLGCEPDFDAYTGRANEKPTTTEPFRTGAGHIHFGWTKGADPFDKEHFNKCRDLVKLLDDTLYPLSLQWDDDQKRRELYGKIGSFRSKHYGMEYRPLSNAFLREDETVRLVYKTAIKVAEDYFNA